MRFKFVDRKLESLYTTGAGAGRFGGQVVDAFLRVMARIDAIESEAELYQFKGLRYEKLKGDRVGERSVRINRQWRLILRPSTDNDGNFLWIIEIIDYH